MPVIEPANCLGSHHYYVAETGAVDLGGGEGKVVVVLVCTACGDGKIHEFNVAGNPQLTKKGK